jgi:excinuclease UvrABC helicase subunit UvrB
VEHIEQLPVESMTPLDKKRYIARLTKEMRQASRDLNFELAAQLRDLITGLP